MDCDEHIILKKLRDGDSEALDILYLRYASKVRDFAFRLLKDRTDAEDVTHDIFLKIWEQRRGLGNILSSMPTSTGRWSINTRLRPGLRRVPPRLRPTTACQRPICWR